MCSETKKATWLVAAAVAHKNASPVLDRVSSGWQQLQHECPKRQSPSSTKKLHGKSVEQHSNLLCMPVQDSHHNPLLTVAAHPLMGESVNAATGVPSAPLQRSLANSEAHAPLFFKKTLSTSDSEAPEKLHSPLQDSQEKFEKLAHQLCALPSVIGANSQKQISSLGKFVQASTGGAGTSTSCSLTLSESCSCGKNLNSSTISSSMICVMPSRPISVRAWWARSRSRPGSPRAWCGRAIWQYGVALRVNLERSVVQPAGFLTKVAGVNIKRVLVLSVDLQILCALMTKKKSKPKRGKM